eukprot:945019-Amphidinium_carterae.1
MQQVAQRCAWGIFFVLVPVRLCHVPANMEAAIVGIDAAIARAVDLGVTNCVIGMPHRGRLNMLVNVVGTHLSQRLSPQVGT